MPPGLAIAGWVVAGVVLASCGIAPAVDGSGQPALSQGSETQDNGTAVPPEAARILANAPSGGQLRYRLPDGVSLLLVLGPSQQSGLGETCRIGRVNASAVGPARPTAYAFCRRGDRWYEMTPVVVSGY